MDQHSQNLENQSIQASTKEPLSIHDMMDESSVLIKSAVLVIIFYSSGLGVLQIL